MYRTMLLLCLTATAALADDFDHTPLEFSVSGDRIIAEGEIDAASLDAFEDLLDDHPDIRILELYYIGGSVDDEANLQFSRVIRRLGFTTIVPSDGLVASGGTDLFLAGSRRILESGACVGVHSWAAEDFTATDIPRSSSEHDRYLHYYEDIDIDPAFYWFTIEAAPAESLHWMTPAEVDRFGVATSAVSQLSSSNICENR